MQASAAGRRSIRRAADQLTANTASRCGDRSVPPTIITTDDTAAAAVSTSKKIRIAMVGSH